VVGDFRDQLAVALGDVDPPLRYSRVNSIIEVTPWKQFAVRASSVDRLAQGHFIDATTHDVLSEFAVDDDGRQAADAVATSPHRDVRVVHVANFDIVLGARQELHEFHCLGSNRATGGKDLDFSPPGHVVLFLSGCC
jgi:hypothetical protein